MLTEVLSRIYERDLNKLKTEIEQYPTDADLWETSGDISNSGGNLCQHLTGNLKHFIGAVIGKSGYVRDRDAEFAAKGVSKQDLIDDIDGTRETILSTLAKLTDAELAEIYPIEVFGEQLTTGYFFTHLTTHFNYHLGQINYHRRLLSGK
jgi:hypothetical protein